MRTVFVILLFSSLLLSLSAAMSVAQQQDTGKPAAEQQAADSLEVAQNVNPVLIRFARLTKQLYLHDSLFEYEKTHTIPHEPSYKPAYGASHTPAVKAY
ncbi:hypothetical protein C7N43_39010 [Sphingobacteriales bacterium UPWRP_1]|nr:hypothetical protein C7N43_39010 [Sphingobacteriales bacterium UPWRP_1]